MFLKIYDYFAQHRWLCWLLLAVLCIGLAIPASRLHYTEDILAFLPFNDEQKEQFRIYQQHAQAQTIVLLVEGNDVDSIIDALELFALNFEERAGGISCRTTIDPSAMARQVDSLSRLLPFSLNETDYLRIDSLLNADYISDQLIADRNRLLMPQTALLQPLISTDPLGLFTDYITPPQQVGSAFDIIDGYIFSADHLRAIAFIDSPYGSNESGNNARLVDLINEIISELQLNNLQIRATGSPVISVGNARRIKQDTILSVSIAVVLIALLLLFNLRRKRDIIYMLCSVGFGFLFALGCIGIFTTEISLIVLGISSIIVGIAVNYPLHVIVHRDQRSDMPTTLREVLSPLIVGNITTVAAFLCLVPLQAKALHDLGIFAALMLVGTIFFSVIFLPQLLEATPLRLKQKNTISTDTSRNGSSLIAHRRNPIDYLSRIELHHNKYVAIALLVLTLVFAYFSPKLTFDSNLHNINYMTAEQRTDLNYFLEIAGQKNTETVYLVQRIESPQKALEQWTTFWQEHQPQLQLFETKASEIGFGKQAFAPFLHLTTATDLYEESIAPLQLIRTCEVNKQQVEEEKARLQALYPTAQVFNPQALNSSIAGALSDNFDYIGLACSLIVFLFLCISLRSLWLGIIAFMPMLIAWVWILGSMYLLDIHFNIVNVILATFIFGQGDDYTIFITEGLLYEEKTGKTILAAYKRSIILSALIMFIGIGVLVIAQHPAMHSLGVVTVLGMAAVVLMAYLIPPLLFTVYKWIINRFPKRK